MRGLVGPLPKSPLSLSPITLTQNQWHLTMVTLCVNWTGEHRLKEKYRLRIPFWNLYDPNQSNPNAFIRHWSKNPSQPNLHLALGRRTYLPLRGSGQSHLPTVTTGWLYATLTNISLFIFRSRHKSIRNVYQDTISNEKFHYYSRQKVKLKPMVLKKKNKDDCRIIE